MCGALDFQDWKQTHQGQPFPVSVALERGSGDIWKYRWRCADRLWICFAGLLRGNKQVVKSVIASWKCRRVRKCAWKVILMQKPRWKDLMAIIPVIITSGFFSNCLLCCMCSRDRFIIPTYTGRPPDEWQIWLSIENEMFIPDFAKTISGNCRFLLTGGIVLIRLAIVTMKKQYAVVLSAMMGVWSFYANLFATKFVIVYVDVNAWLEDGGRYYPVWSPRVTTLVKIAIDYLDFASPVAGLDQWALMLPINGLGEAYSGVGRADYQRSCGCKKIDEIWDSQAFSA